MSYRICELLVALEICVAGCAPSSGTIDVCARERGPTLAQLLAGGQLRVTALDKNGNSVSSTTIMSDRPTRVTILPESAASSVRVEALTSQGTVVSTGSAPLSLQTCVCLPEDPGACDGLRCQMSAGKCQFLDESGALAAPLGMVVVSQPSRYYMDATEVTNAQYARFLAGNFRPDNPPAACASKSSFQPATAAGGPDTPVTHVDWCDAWAYCAWASRRLCGRIGGGPNPYAEFDRASASQWFNACSSGGQLSYPYGNTFASGTCIDFSYPFPAGTAVPQPVGSASRCVGGFPGIFDMSGNVWEWEDSCDAVTTSCHARGGAFYSDMSHATCTGMPTNTATTPLSSSDTIGFRCCSE